jgi:hypothetical protein
VTFYVDSAMIGSNLTDQSGIAQLSKGLPSGRHTWFASADREGEGGISSTTLFVVGQLASLVSGDSYEFLGPGVQGHSGALPLSFHWSRATRIRNSSALNE